MSDGDCVNDRHRRYLSCHLARNFCHAMDVVDTVRCFILFLFAVLHRGRITQHNEKRSTLNLLKSPASEFNTIGGVTREALDPLAHCNFKLQVYQVFVTRKISCMISMLSLHRYWIRVVYVATAFCVVCNRNVSLLRTTQWETTNCF